MGVAGTVGVTRAVGVAVLDGRGRARWVWLHVVGVQVLSVQSSQPHSSPGFVFLLCVFIFVSFNF